MIIKNGIVFTKIGNWGLRSTKNGIVINTMIKLSTSKVVIVLEQDAEAQTMKISSLYYDTRTLVSR